MRVQKLPLLRFIPYCKIFAMEEFGALMKGDRMKKLIAVTALAGLIVAGCAHRDRSNNYQGGTSDTSSYSSGSMKDTNTNSSIDQNSSSSKLGTGATGNTGNSSSSSSSSDNSSSSSTDKSNSSSTPQK